MAKLLGYTVVNSGFSAGAAGNINITSGPTVSVDKDQVISLNGDPKVHSFLDGSGNLRVVVSQYDFGGSPIGFRIYDPSTNPWTPVTGVLTWPSIVNLYGVVTVDGFLYAIDFDGANVAKISLTGGTPYTQVGSYNYSVSGKVTAGIAITALVNDDHVYALFIVADDDSFSSYQDSTVVKLDVSGTNPSSVATATVGKNAFTLTPYDGKLYVACVGGPQQAGSYNSGNSKLNVVTASTMGVTTPFTAGSGSPAIPGDFRDITFSDSGDAYILTGYYDSSFANLIGRLYRTSEANINSGTPSVGTTVFTFTSPGYFWATLYQDDTTDNFWFAKGNPIQIFQPPPTSGTDTPISTKTPSDLGSGSVNANLNSVTPFWEPSALALRQAGAGRAAARSLTAHARLAEEARSAAEERKKKETA